MMAAASSQIWGSAAWWFVFITSLPFSVYVWPFAINDFDSYRMLTLNFADKNYDLAGLHIRDHHKTWQTHSITALVYIVTGLFQFSPRFREAYPVIHRRMGYAFSGATMVQCFTGMVLMNPICEFGTVGRTTFFLLGLYLFISTCVAVGAARQKKFKLHQRWMIRAAAIGYSVIGVRLWINMLLAAGMYLRIAAEVGAVLAPISFVLPAEIYIKTYLDDHKKNA